MRMLKPSPAPAVPRSGPARPPLRLLPPPEGAGEQPPAAARAAVAPAAPLHHAQNWFKLAGEAMARQAVTGMAAATLLPLMRADTGAELLELQFAVAGRVHALQQDWWQGWTQWLGEFSELRHADTLSEHMEQQYNLVEQFNALLKNQAADLLDLQDNVEVNYGYWAAQKLAQREG